MSLPLPVRLIIEEEDREEEERVVERLAEKIAARIAPAIPTPVTRKFERTDIVVDRGLDIVVSRFPGTLRDMTVVGLSDKYELVFLLDNDVKLRGTWQELANLSKYTEIFSCYASDGKYVFATGNWSWSYSAFIILRVAESVRFEKIIAIWDEYS